MKIIFFILLFNIVLFVSAETLSFNTADTAPYSTSQNDGFYDILLTETMQNLGLELIINHYPSERSILWADEGHDDGEFARISGLSDTYSNLQEVEEPLVAFYFVVIKKENSSVSPTKWQDLKDLRVGYLRGWKIYENNVGDGENITILQNIDSMFNMLISDRLDVILYSKLRADEYITDHDLKDIMIVETPLSVRTMHLYMHNQHDDLIPQINIELKKLKESGRYDQIFKKYLQK